MSKAIIQMKLEVDYLYCSKCKKRPLDFKQASVDKFLKEHARHKTNFNEYCNLVGYLKRPTKLKDNKVVIHFVNDPPKEKIRCKYKKCKYFSKKATTYHHIDCEKANHKRRK